VAEAKRRLPAVGCKALFGQEADTMTLMPPPLNCPTA
jgi:hypothetical protein